MDTGAHVSVVPCLPPTCHECGYEWKQLYERSQTTIRELKKLIETIDRLGGLGHDIHARLKEALK